jgi:hypothetical protein
MKSSLKSWSGRQDSNLCIDLGKVALYQLSYSRSNQRPLGWSLRYELDASKTEKPGQVIAELDQVFHKNV